MKRKLFAGSTSVQLPVFIQDTTSSTGGGLSGLAHNTSGLAAAYRRIGQSSWTTITLVSKTLGTYVSGGFIADNPSVAGTYELDLPDAALAAGARGLYVHLWGVANMMPVLIEIELDAINYQDATRAGLAALPNANAGANGGLPLGDAAGRVTVGALAAGIATAIANEVEAQIIDETDSEKVLEAIVNKINAMTDLDALTLAAIASVVTAEIERVGGPVKLIQAQADKIGTNSGDSPNAVTAQGNAATAAAQAAAAANSASTAATNTGTLLTDLAALALKFSGITSIANWIRAGLRKSSPDATAISEINSGGGTYDPTTDSPEAIRDRGDAAWAGTGLTAQDVRNAQGLAYTGTTSAAVGSVDKTLTDILSATNTIGGGKIVHRGPVTSDGHITIVRGDDYNVASGQPLEWTDTGGSWPTLTGASISFTARVKNANGTIGSVAMTTAGSVVTGSGANKKVRVEPLKAATGALTPGNRNHRFDVQATLSTGEVITLVMGEMTVLEDITT